jgi:hypothetical protein
LKCWRKRSRARPNEDRRIEKRNAAWETGVFTGPRCPVRT